MAVISTLMQVLLLLILIASLTYCEGRFDSDQITSDYETNSSRQKRDTCTGQATVDIIEKSVDFLMGADPKNLIGAVRLLSPVLGSVYGFQSPTTCDLNAKLDTILTKLDEIAEAIKHIPFHVDCGHIKNNYVLLSDSIQGILRLLRAYQNKPIKGRQAIRDQVNKTCQNDANGIRKIFNDFIQRLSKKDAMDFIRNCAQYESKIIAQWQQKVKQLAYDIIHLVYGCEQAFGSATGLDFNKFAYEIENTLEYYSKVAILEEFVGDKGPLGLRNAVKVIANDGKSADETVQRLKEKYDYFNWDVIYYSSKLRGGEYHWAIYQPRESHCGSEFYLRELNHGRNALVAWCIPNNESPIGITVVNYDGVDAGENARKMERNNENLNYVLVIVAAAGREPPKLDFNDRGHSLKGPWISDSLTRFSPNDDHRWRDDDWPSYVLYSNRPYQPAFRRFFSYTFASRQTFVLKMVAPKFTTDVLIFEPGHIRVILVYEYDIRLHHHYKAYTEVNDIKCFQACKAEKQCAAASFYGQWSTNCYFFGITYGIGRQSDWISYIKPEEPNTLITDQNTRLTGHYKAYSEVDGNKCFQACKAEKQCAAASFYGRWSMNCYFFRKGFRKTTESNWISYIKPEEPNTLITDRNTKLTGHYKASTEVNDIECFQACKSEKPCAAASFYGQWSTNCYFFKKEFTKAAESSGTSYIKPEVPNPLITDQNTRLYDHYKENTEVDDHTCFQACKVEKQCGAASFFGDRQINCFFFRKDQFSRGSEYKWISYIKPEEPNPLITDRNTKLTGHYKAYSEVDGNKCFQACKSEKQCAAASFHGPYLFECFFFNRGFEKVRESNWISYIKT